jgi:hypothetical protein
MDNNKFANFGYLKSHKTLNKFITVDPYYGMLHWGLVLSLQSFEGAIILTSNTFDSNLIQTSGGCSVAEDISLSYNIG